MKPLILAVALFALAEQQQCKNPFDTVTNPTAAGPRSPLEFCAQLTNNFGAYFYCDSTQGNLQGGLPNNWTGFCAIPGETLGNTGYVATTFAGGRDLARSQSNASAVCSQLGSQCGGYIRCTR